MSLKNISILNLSLVLIACGGGGGGSDSSNSQSNAYSADDALTYFKSELSTNKPSSVRFVTDDCSYDLEGYGSNFLVSCVVQSSDLSSQWGIATLSSLVELSNGSNTLSSSFGSYNVALKNTQTLTDLTASNQVEFVTGYYKANGYVCDATECILTASNLDKTTCVISTQSCLFEGYVYPALGAQLRVYGRELRDRFLMVDNLPALPIISSDYSNNLHANYISGESTLNTVIGYSTGWEGTSSLNIENARTPTCIETSGTSGICYVFNTDTEVHECEWQYPTGETPCKTYSTIPESLMSLMRSQHTFHGFDYATQKNYQFTKSVIVGDDGFEPTHTILDGKVRSTNIVLDDNSVRALTLDDPLIRFSGTTDWANVFSLRHHGSNTSSIIAFEGAEVELWSRGLSPAKFIENITVDANSIVSLAINLEGEIPSFGNFVVAGGNLNQDWSTATTEQGYITANAGNLNRMLFVGAVTNNKVSSSYTAIAGNDVSIQNRWLVALGDDVLTASTIAGTKNFIQPHTGTSEAEPFVAKALALASSVCTGSTIPELMQLLLDTADKSFTGYDASNHGMGLLSVKGALVKIEDTGCP